MAMVLKRPVGAPTQLERGMSMSLACAVVVLVVLVFALGLGVRNLARPQPQLPTFVRLVPIPPEVAVPEPATNARMPASESTKPLPPPPRPREIADLSTKRPSFDEAPAPTPKPSVQPTPPEPRAGVERGGIRSSTGAARPGLSGPGTKPIGWIAPDDNFIDRIYPERARAEGVSGSATLLCELLWNTRVRKCRILSETPPKYGFGRAMLDASPSFRLIPPKRDGKVVRSIPLKIQLEFRLRSSG